VQASALRNFPQKRSLLFARLHFLRAAGERGYAQSTGLAQPKLAGSSWESRLRALRDGEATFAWMQPRAGWLARPKLTNLLSLEARLRALRYGGAAFAGIRERRLASLRPASWNQIKAWLRTVDELRRAA